MTRWLVMALILAVGGCAAPAAPDHAPVARLSDEGARDQMLSVSPDGQRVAFWRPGDNGFDLWVADADMGNARRLGVSSLIGNQAAAVWSEDGSRLAASTSAVGVSDVAVVDLATDSVRVVVASPAFKIPIQFHPDGDRLIYASYGSGGTVKSFQVSIGTGAISALIPGLDDPTIGYISPDGANVAYTDFGGGTGSSVGIAAVDGGERRRVTSEGYEAIPSLVGSPWSPDGKSFLYLSTRTGKSDIWVAATDGASRQLTTDISADWAPSWSPGGKWVAFLSERGRQTDIWVMPANGGPATRVTDDLLQEDQPRWLDDTTIVYSSMRSPAVYMRRAVADTVETRILADSIDPGAFWESPDRQWLAFRIDHPGGGNDLAIIHPDGTGLRVLSRDAQHAGVTWDPSSSRLAWMSDLGGSPDVYMADTAGDGQMTRVDDWPGYEAPAYFTVDGSGLVISSDRDSRLGDLWRIPLGAGDTTRLTRFGSVNAALGVRVGGRDLPVLQMPDSATGELVLYALEPGNRLRPIRRGNGTFPIQPINHLLASAVPTGDNGSGVVIYGIDGTVVRRLDQAAGPRAFSPDDSRLLFSMKSAGEVDLAMIDVASGEITRLTNTPDDETHAMFTAGGDSIVFRRVRITSEMMRADLAGLLKPQP